MSIGAPSNLGTTLVQRLDTMLGVVLGQEANLISGAGQQAVTQPGGPENPSPAESTTNKPAQNAVEQADAKGEQRAAVGRAGREMQLDNLLGRSTTFRGLTQSAPTTLGYAARIILALLNEYPQAPRSIRGTAPLLPQASTGGVPANQANLQGLAGGTGAQAPGANAIWAQLASALGQPGALPAHLAQALSQSIQQSGLFYEAHLAQVAKGALPAEALRQEPQGQLPPARGQTPSAPSAPLPAPAAQHDANLPPLLLQADSGTEGRAAAPHQNAPSQQAAAPQTNPVPGIDPQAQQLVRQQLDVLANQGFVWQGEAWPGADMQCEIQRRFAGEEEGDHEVDETHWATRLTLRLPNLGAVHARLNLAGDQLVMRLNAPQAAERLDAAIEPLRARLTAHGLQAVQLSVSDEDADHADAAS